MTNPVEREMKRALDPVELLRGIGLDPVPWQVDLLRSSSARILMLMSRQAGKSTCASVLAVHQCVYTPHSSVLIVSKTIPQAELLYQKSLQLYRGLGRPAPAKAENQRSLGLENGSTMKIVVAHEENVRGHSAAAMIIVDEAAIVPDPGFRALWPMVAASGGKLIVCGTPAGKRGEFYSLWTRGGPRWLRVQVKAEDCPWLSADVLAEERENRRGLTGRGSYAEEYETLWVENEQQVFSDEDIERSFDPSIQPFIPGKWGSA